MSVYPTELHCDFREHLRRYWCRHLTNSTNESKRHRRFPALHRPDTKAWHGPPQEKKSAAWGPLGTQMRKPHPLTSAEESRTGGGGTQEHRQGLSQPCTFGLTAIIGIHRVINKIKDKTHRGISTDAENNSDKTATLSPLRKCSPG